MAGGYIKLYRNLLENPVTSKPEYAWLWCVMLLSTNHKDIKKYWNGESITIKAGQFITGRKKLSKQTGLSENKIYRALKYFESEHQIKQQKNNKFTLITILNWNKYQGNGTTNEQQNEQQIDNQSTTNRQQIDTNKNDKNVKNDKKNTIVEQQAVPQGNIPYKDIVKIFNSICETLPKLKVLSNSRVNALRLRWGKYGKKHGIEFFKELFERANESDFLSGRNGKWTACNFDWLIKETNMIKVMEGNYDNRTGN